MGVKAKSTSSQVDKGPIANAGSSHKPQKNGIPSVDPHAGRRLHASGYNADAKADVRGGQQQHSYNMSRLLYQQRDDEPWTPERLGQLSFVSSERTNQMLAELERDMSSGSRF